MRAMKVVLSLFVVVGLASVVLSNTPGAKNRPASPGETDSLIVHEWGTFTSISGSDGVRLEFRPLIDNDLPEFVINRAWQAGRAPSLFLKWSISSFQRMETPVTYFYTDREREVSVKVGFPQGLLTEFYPPVATMKPDFNFNKRAEIGNSELDWGRVTLIPTSHFRPQVASLELANLIHDHTLRTIAPASDSHPHYGYARETDSAIVHVRRTNVSERPYTPSGDFFEKFLFYRGVGNFSLPLKLTATGSRQFELSNDGSDPIRSLFLVTAQAGEIQFQKYDSIAAGSRLVLEQAITTSSIDDLSQAVAKALVGEGLFEKEAQAMVKTWHDSWFQEEGTRLFYMLPERLTDELLPLTIQPRPDKTVRVMVGRLEIITPEEESRITQIVQTSARARQEVAVQAAAVAAALQIAEQQQESKPESKDDARDNVVATAPPSAPNTEPPAKPKLPEALAQMGRLAEPALARVKYFSKDATVRGEADALLKEFHEHWKAAGN